MVVGLALDRCTSLSSRFRRRANFLFLSGHGPLRRFIVDRVPHSASLEPSFQVGDSIFQVYGRELDVIGADANVAPVQKRVMGNAEVFRSIVSAK
jgi:hypothetical protein